MNAFWFAMTARIPQARDTPTVPMLPRTAVGFLATEFRAILVRPGEIFTLFDPDG